MIDWRLMIIIDGHNLIGAFSDLHFDDLNVKDKLLEKLKKYRQIMDVKLIVVFDGIDKTGFGRYINEGIEIRFPENNQSADKLIIDLCQEFSHAHDTVIVSSDREIKDAVKKAGLISKDNRTFAEEIKDVIEKFDQEDEMNDYLSPAEIDDWLKYFGKK